MADQPLISGQIKRLDSNIRYWIHGADHNPLVVFTHGATLDHTMFDQQIPALVDNRYRVLTWDMRGHGVSKPLGEKFDVQTVSDDLLCILDTIQCKQAYIFGHSFGGFVTQEFVFRHPERVIAMGIIGCTDLSAKPSPVMRIASKILPYTLPLSSIESFQKQTIKNLSKREKIKQYALKTTALLSKEEFIKIIMAGVECLGYDSGYGINYTIPKPFLLTHGEEDEANGGIFIKKAPKWAEKEPNCVYKIVPDAGHTANQDNPEYFNQLLLNFLTQYSVG